MVETGSPVLRDEAQHALGLREDLYEAPLVARALAATAPLLPRIDPGLFGSAVMAEIAAWSAREARREAAIAQGSRAPAPGISGLKTGYPVHAMLMELGKIPAPASARIRLAAQLVCACHRMRRRVEDQLTTNPSGFASTAEKACLEHRRLTAHALSLLANLPETLPSAHAWLDRQLDTAISDTESVALRDFERAFAYALGYRESPNRGPRSTRRSRSQLPAADPVITHRDPEAEARAPVFTVVRSTPSGAPDEQTLDELGLASEENQLGTELLSCDEPLQAASGETPAGMSLRLRNARRHRHKAAQLASGRWDVLSEYDLIQLFEALERQRAEHPEAVALLTVMLMTGEGEERAVETRVYPNHGSLPDAKSTASLQLVTREGTWHRRTLWPKDARQCRREWASYFHLTSRRLSLPIPKPFWRYLEPALSRATRNLTTGSTRLFSDDADSVIEAAKKLLSATNARAHTRLTAHRIHMHLFQSLIEGEGDTAEATLITGYLPPSGQSAALYYHNCAAARLTQLYQNALAQWPLPMDFFGYKSLSNRDVSAGSQVCAPLTVLQVLVRDLIESVRLAQQNWIGPYAWIGFHNAYTRYTIMLLLFTTGYRTIDNPLRREEDIDWTSRLIVIQDKAGERLSRSRVVPLAQPCWQQLENFRAHRAEVLLRLESSMHQKVPFLFFLTPSAQVERVGLHSLKHHFNELFRLPLNINRHLIRRFLRDEGVPGEAVDSYMGHWGDGQNPWGRFSAMDPWRYQNRVGRAIEKLSLTLGWRSLEGLA